MHDQQKSGTRVILSEWEMETRISKFAEMSVVGKEYFRVHVLKNNCECHQRFSQRKRTERDVTQRPFALWFRVHSYITSQSTHFLNMPDLGSIIRGSSMEGRLGLHLQSAVRWQGDSNENDTGQKWTVNRWDIHKLNYMRMNI